MKTVLLCVLAGCVAAALPLLVTLLSPSWRHRRNRRVAERVYSRINEIRNESDEWLIHYLQKIDPYVFEELILLAFRKRGYTAIHNRRYSGDGGLDGRLFRKGKRYFIQAKRYTGYVNLEHVKEFITLCKKSRCKGFFVTTGKASRTVNEIITESGRVELLEGMKLYDLFIDNGRQNKKTH